MKSLSSILQNLGCLPGFCRWQMQELRETNNVRPFCHSISDCTCCAINYIILSTAVSTGRRLEIGIRKLLVPIRSIKNQLLSESVLLALIVLPIALILMIALRTPETISDQTEYYQFKYCRLYQYLSGSDNNYRCCLRFLYFILFIRA